MEYNNVVLIIDGTKETFQDIFQKLKTLCIEDDAKYGFCVVDNQCKITVIMEKLKENNL